MFYLCLLSLCGLAMADIEPASPSSPSFPDWHDLLIGADLQALMGLAVVGSRPGNQREEGREERRRVRENIYIYYLVLVDVADSEERLCDPEPCPVQGKQLVFTPSPSFRGQRQCIIFTLKYHYTIFRPDNIWFQNLGLPCW